jgi:hypothetical protein
MSGRSRRVDNGRSNPLTATRDQKTRRLHKMSPRCVGPRQIGGPTIVRTNAAMKHWIPSGWRAVTPRLVVDDVSEMGDFLRRAFRASGERDLPGWRGGAGWMIGAG